MEQSRDYSNFRTNRHTVSYWCFYCYGSGGIRKRDTGIIPRITFERCKKCKKARRLWYDPNSLLWKTSQKIIKGLTPGIRKHDNDKGTNRR